MKKVISACLFIVTILSFLMIQNFYQSKDYEQTAQMGQTANAFNFYIQNGKMTPSEEIDFFTFLAKKYHATFILTSTNKGIEKSVITDTKSFPLTSFRIKKINFSNSNNFYASYQTNQKNQVGTIPVFSKNNKIVLQTLNRHFKSGIKNIDGTYTAVLSKNNKKAIVKQLSQNLNESENKLLTPTGNSQVGYVNKTLYLLVLAIVISILVFILVNIYLPISQITVIGVQKLNGWRDLSVFYNLIKSGIVTIVITSIGLDVLSLFLFPYRPQGFMVTCFLVQLGILGLYFVANTFAFLVIKNMTISDLLNNRYHFDMGTVMTYLLKLLMSVATIVLLLGISTSLNGLIKQERVQETWKKEGNILTVDTIGTFADNVRTSDAILHNWYQQINRNKGVYYINSDIFNVQDILPNRSNFVNNLGQNNIKVMAVNDNFLNEKYPRLDTQNIDFLVPSKFRHTNIRYVLQCMKYNELSSNQQNKINPKKININVKYYKQNISSITYNPNIKRIFNKPIFEIVDSENMTELQIMMLGNTDKNSPIKIKNTKQNRATLRALSKHQDIQKLGLKFIKLKSLLAAVVDDFENELHILLIVLSFVIVLNAFTTAFLIFCIISDRQKELAVKRLLGYRRIDCYKYEFLFLLFLGLIEIITLVTLHANELMLLAAGAITLIDLVIFYVIAGFLESKKLPFLLKGGLS